MWYKHSKIVLSASDTIVKFLSPLPVPEVVENANSNVQMEIAFCYKIAEERDSGIVQRMLSDLANNIFNLKQNKRIQINVSKRSLKIKSIYDDDFEEYEDLDEIVEAIDFVMSQEKPKQVVSEITEIEPIFTSGQIRVFNPKTAVESELACVDTSWCIGRRGSGMFYRYRFENSANFYIVEDLQQQYPFRKVAIDIRKNSEITDEVNLTGERLSRPMKYNGVDYGSSIAGYMKYLSDVTNGEINSSIFKERPLTPEEESDKKRLFNPNNKIFWFSQLSYQDKEKYMLVFNNKLTDAQFKFLYDRKNVFKDLLISFAGSQAQFTEFQYEIIKKEPQMKRNYDRNELLARIENGQYLTDEGLQNIVDNKFFNALERYIRNNIENMPYNVINFSKNNIDFGNYVKKFLLSEIIFSGTKLDPRTLLFFNEEELRQIYNDSNASELLKTTIGMLFNEDELVDKLAHQEIDYNLAETCLMSKTNMEAFDKKVQDKILSEKILVYRPFFLDRKILTDEFIDILFKNRQIDPKCITGITSKTRYGDDELYDERDYNAYRKGYANRDGTLLLLLDHNNTGNVDFDLYTKAIATGTMKIKDLHEDVRENLDEYGLGNIYKIMIMNANTISDIPLDIVKEPDFLIILNQTRKFQPSFLHTMTEKQQKVITSALLEIMSEISTNSLMMFMSFLMPKYRRVIEMDLGMEMEDYDLTTYDPSNIIQVEQQQGIPQDANSKITRLQAMSALDLNPNDFYDNKIANDLSLRDNMYVRDFNEAKTRYEGWLSTRTKDEFIEWRYLSRD